MLDASGTQHLLLAETLGLAMARRAADILERHRAALASGGTGAGGTAPEDDDDQFALDNALLQVIYLAQLATLTQLSPGGRPPSQGRSSRRGGPPSIDQSRRSRLLSSEK